MWGEDVYVHDMDSCFCSLTEAQTQLFNSELESFVPAEVCISLKQGTGPAAVPVVDVGERVACGQLIGKSMAPTSLPVYASISGQVTAITEKRMSVSEMVSHIVIRREGDKSAWVREAGNVKDMAAWLKAVGIAGVTEKEAPLFVKAMEAGTGERLKLAAFDREPQVFCDYRLIMECPGKILFGAKVMAELLGIVCMDIYVCHDEIRYVLEKTWHNYKKALSSLEKICFFKVKSDAYHKSCIPARDGMWLSASQLCAVYDGFYDGRPMTGRGMTICGAVKTPKNVWVPNGTHVRDLLEFCGGIAGEKAYVSEEMAEKKHLNIIEGGPMGGHCVDISCAHVSLTSGSLHVLPRILYREQPCIRCHSCCQVCPARLKPYFIEKVLDASGGPVHVTGASSCVGCGWCSYVCPSFRRLKEKIHAAGKISAREGDLERNSEEVKRPVSLRKRRWKKKICTSEKKSGNGPVEAGAYIDLDWELAGQMEPLVEYSQGGPYIHKDISIGKLYNRLCLILGFMLMVYTFVSGPRVLFKAAAAGVCFAALDGFYFLISCHIKGKMGMLPGEENGWRIPAVSGMASALALAFVPSWRWAILAGAVSWVWKQWLKGNFILAGVTVSLCAAAFISPVFQTGEFSLALTWLGVWLYMGAIAMIDVRPFPAFFLGLETVFVILEGTFIFNPMVFMGGVLFANDYGNGGKGTGLQGFLAVLSGILGGILSIFLPGGAGICLGLFIVNIMACNLNTHTI